MIIKLLKRWIFRNRPEREFAGTGIEPRLWDIANSFSRTSENGGLIIGYDVDNCYYLRRLLPVENASTEKDEYILSKKDLRSRIMRQLLIRLYREGGRIIGEFHTHLEEGQTVPSFRDLLTIQEKIKKSLILYEYLLCIVSPYTKKDAEAWLFSFYLVDERSYKFKEAVIIEKGKD